jgi:hypothetical protein
MDRVDQFRRIFVIDPSHDVSKLKQHTSEIKLITRGDERSEDIEETIVKSLADFDPACDAIIPMGKVVVSFVTGVVLGKMFPSIGVTVGIYGNEKYQFIELENI